MTLLPVLVLTNTRDFAADVVIRHLTEAGRPVVRYNADRPPAVAGRIDDIAPVGAIWWRQYERWYEGRAEAEEVDDLLIERAQWRAWLSMLDDGSVRWVNPPWSARTAENKLVQLRCAAACGFRLPETLITNRIDEARRFGATRTAIVKTLSAAYFEFSGGGFVYTRELQDALRRSPEEWGRQPLIVQARIDGNDARVVSFNGRHYGARCLSPDVDWRQTRPPITWEHWEVPSSIQHMCDRYLQALGLRYAAFDFRLADDEVFFLEANQAGEWNFLERQLQLGIPSGFAEYLADLADRRE